MVKILVSVREREDIVGDGVVDYDHRVVKVKINDCDGEKEFVYPFESIEYFRFMSYSEYENRMK